MRRKKVVAVLAGVAVSASALACAMIPSLVVNGLVVVDVMDLEYQRWDKISAAMDQWYGAQYQNVQILSVVVPLRHCVLGACVDFERTFAKKCNVTLGSRAKEISWHERPYADGGGGSSGDIGNIGDVGGGGQLCEIVAKTGTGCVSAGGGGQKCESQTWQTLECWG